MAEIKDYISKWRGEEIDALLGLVSSHVNDATIHLQPGEREKWNTGSSSGGGSSVITNVYWSDILNRPSWISDTPPEIFDLFEKVITKEAVDEVRDADGNIVTEAQPAEYAIKAKYDLFSVGGVSTYGFSGTGSGGGTASVDVTAILKEGVHIATINGVNIFAPEGGGTASVDVTPLLTSGTQIATINGVSIFAPKGGASSWNELTGTAPGVSTFPNDAKYLTSAALSGALSGYATKSEVNGVLTTVANNYVSLNTFNTYKGVVTSDIASSAKSVKDWVMGQRYGKSLGINGNYLRLLDENGSELNKVIAPYAAYTEQLGATGSNSAVSIYGEVKMENGSLAVAGNVNANYTISAGGDLSAAGSLSVTGESRFSASVYIGDAANLSAKYLWFAYRGIFFEGEGATSGNPWYGTLCTHDAYTLKSINLRCFDGWTQINQLGVGGGFLTGTQSPSYTLDVSGTARVSVSLKTGDCQANYFVLSNNDGTYDYGRIVTPAWKARIDMSEAYNGMISLACGGAEYLSMNAAEGVLRSLKGLYITHDDGLRIGNAYLRYDKVNNALYVTGQDGAQVHLYATGGIAAYSGLGSGITQLANLSLTGQLTAASVMANSVGSDGVLRLNAGSESSIILNKNMTVDSDGWITTPQLNATQRILVNSGGDIRIGSIAAEYRITDVHADGTYVYITINGKQYRLYCI